MRPLPTIISCALAVGLVVQPLASAAGGASADLEYVLDINGPTIPLPELFRPAIDLAGRGFHYDPTWPQALAGSSSLDLWAKEFGFRGLYRVQYNLWEISQLAGNRELQGKLMANYEAVIKRVSDAGGTVILDMFSMPLGQGKVLDKKSAPVDPQVFENTVRDVVRYFSCIKKYNVWYEVWSAPDLDTFFLGREQEYLQMYRSAAIAVKGLEKEYNMHIALGGPSTSAWFRGVEESTVSTPEKSLVFQLMRMCYHQRLPLDFVSWHGYSSDPKIEKESTAYTRHALALLREWLGYFNFNDVLLVVDEWNYDDGANQSPQRGERAHVCASYIPARLRHMYEAGVDRQVFYCLEDFRDNREGVDRNVGAFWFTQNAFQSESGPKTPVLNVFRMLAVLGAQMYVPSVKFNDECVGVIATRSNDQIVVIVYNYIDPEMARNFVSRSLSALNEADRRQVVSLFKKDQWDDLLNKKIDPERLAVSSRVKALLRRSAELYRFKNDRAAGDQTLSLVLRNMKEDFLLQRYQVDDSCADSCLFLPDELRQLSGSTAVCTLQLQLKPYSVQLLVFSKKPKTVEQPPAAIAAPEPPGTPAPQTSDVQQPQN